MKSCNIVTMVKTMRDDFVELLNQIKSQASFQAWMKEIRVHREYRQAEMKNDDTLRPETNGSRVVSVTLIYVLN